MKAAVIADLHHFSRTLCDGGRAFELRSGSDQKCLAETGDIIDAAFERIAASDVDVVLIAGDVSDDGERVSHEEFRAKAVRLAEKKPVVIITSTHDWCCDGNARSYFGDEVRRDVPTVDRSELFDMYFPLAGMEPCSVITTPQGFTSVSYIVKDCRILAVVDDQNGKGASGYPPELLDWIKTQLAEAADAGQSALMMEHHLVIPCFVPLVNSGQCIGERDEMCRELADAGLKYLFVGHSHMQRVAQYVSPSGNKLTQVNVGSLTGHPAPINFVTVDGNGMTIDVEYVDRFTFDGRERTGLYIKEHTVALLRNVLQAAMVSQEELFDRLRALNIKEPEAFGKLYPIIRSASKIALEGTVGEFLRFAAPFCDVPKGLREAAKYILDEPVFYYISGIFTNLFDNTMTEFPAGTAANRVITAIAGIPGRLTRFVPAIGDFAGQFETLVRLLTEPPAFGREHIVI